jgi:hypothetical protein
MQAVRVSGDAATYVERATRSSARPHDHVFERRQAVGVRKDLKARPRRSRATAVACRVGGSCRTGTSCSTPPRHDQHRRTSMREQNIIKIFTFRDRAMPPT